MSWETTIDLQPYFFTESEKSLATLGGLTASTFRYSTGVAGLRLTNELGYLTVLPYQGQQVWDAVFLGRTLTMRSMIKEPVPTSEYLRTYGAFILHCGALRMGVPGKTDDHPLHGELPNAPYQKAQLLVGEDERGQYLGVTGSYQYTVAFNHNYIARPLVKLYTGSSHFPVGITVRNLKKTPMDLMYLAHVNFRPVDNGELVYSAACTPKTVRVRAVIPSHIHPAPGYAEFLAELSQNPAMHHILKPGMAFDPEVVFFIDYLTGEDGWAHSMQIHPDGSADFISHRVDQLDHGVRWISRTPDQDALGINLPATAEPDGYTNELAKGNLKSIPGGGVWTCQMEVGALPPKEAQALRQKIEQIVKDRG